MRRICTALLLVVAQLLPFQTAQAGVDLAGHVQRVQVDGNGALWFVIDSANASTYCRPGWFDFNMYIPANHPQYACYYGLLLTALTKPKPVFIANISVFNGSSACDITQAGYGIVLLK